MFIDLLIFCAFNLVAFWPVEFHCLSIVALRASKAGMIEILRLILCDHNIPNIGVGDCVEQNL